MVRYLNARVVAVGAAALCLVAATACSSSGGKSGGSGGSSGAALPLSLNLTAGSVTALSEFVARDMGFLKKAGLNAKSISTSGGTAATQLLTSGQLDIALIDIPAILNSRAAGAKVSMVAGGETRAPVALQCRKGVAKATGYPDGVKSLAGKSVGISGVGASSDTYARVILASAGVDPSKATVPLGGVPNYIAAVKAKRIACVMSFQPIQQKLVGDVDTIVDIQNGQGPEVLLNAQYDVFATSDQFAQSNPEAIKRFRSAMKATNTFLSNPANAEAVVNGVIKDFPGVSKADLLTLVKGVQASFKGADTVTATRFQNSVKAYNIAYGKNLTATQPDLTVK